MTKYNILGNNLQDITEGQKIIHNGRLYTILQFTLHLGRVAILVHDFETFGIVRILPNNTTQLVELVP